VGESYRAIAPKKFVAPLNSPTLESVSVQRPQDGCRTLFSFLSSQLARCWRGDVTGIAGIRYALPTARCLKSSGILKYSLFGEVQEWLNWQHWKCCVRGTVPWVRIPPSPPFDFGMRIEKQALIRQRTR
jgi:hypothetical protein